MYNFDERVREVVDRIHKWFDQHPNTVTYKYDDRGNVIDGSELSSTMRLGVTPGCSVAFFAALPIVAEERSEDMPGKLVLEGGNPLIASVDEMRHRLMSWLDEHSERSAIFEMKTEGGRLKSLSANFSLFDLYEYPMEDCNLHDNFRLAVLSVANDPQYGQRVRVETVALDIA